MSLTPGVPAPGALPVALLAGGEEHVSTLLLVALVAVLSVILIAVVWAARAARQAAREAAAAAHARAALEESNRALAATNAAAEAANRELRRLNADLDRVVYAAAHDLRAPLRGVQNLVGFLREDLKGERSPQVESHLRRLSDRAARMERLLDDVVAYARAGQGARMLSEVDLAALCAEQWELVSAPEGFQLVSICEAPPVRAHRPVLEQAVRNLLSNAIKHHDRDRGVVTVRAAAAGSMVELTIEDDGPGIPPDQAERVFLMFQTLAPSGTRAGSGLGLALVRRLAEQEGGSVEMLPREGRGCRVVLRWPLQAVEGPARA